MSTSNKRLFLSKENIAYLSARSKRDAKDDMIKWVNEYDIDSHRSASGDYSETLDYINRSFLRCHPRTKEGVYDNNHQSGKYPAIHFSDTINYGSLYTVRDFDAYCEQKIFRVNDNFRYGNKIPMWQKSMNRHHHDRENHAEGLRDHRELNTHVRGYNMKNILGPNSWKSSDSHDYNYHLHLPAEMR